jgi:WD40 repeat protein
MNVACRTNPRGLAAPVVAFAVLVSALGMGWGASGSYAQSAAPAGRSWKEVDPDLVGNVHALLVSDTIQHPTARKQFPLDKAVIRGLAAFTLVDQLQTLAILAVRDGALELRTIDLESGKVSEPVATIPSADPSCQMTPGPDGISVIVQAGRGKPIEVYDLKTRARRTTMATASDAGEYGAFFAPDAATLVATTKDGRIQRWDLGTGESKGAARIPTDQGGGPFFAVACVERTVLVGFRPSNGPSTDEAVTLLAVDIASGEVKAKTEVVGGPVSVGDGCGSFILGSASDAGWKDMCTYKVSTLEKGAAHAMKPAISSIQTGLARGSDLLVMLEYMVNVIVVWDTKTGEPIATMPPELGGSVRFEVSRDGSTLVSLSGPFVEGSIVPDHWEIYDLRGLQPKAASVPAPK